MPLAVTNWVVHRCRVWDLSAVKLHFELDPGIL